MTAPILFTRLGWISAALVFALRGIQQERSAAVAPTAEPLGAGAHARALADTT
jgi:hypothetical protein